MTDVSGGVHRIADFADADGLIRGLKATGATFLGPAVLMPLGAIEFSGNCNINDGGGGPEAIVWEIDDARKIVVGAIGLTESSFADCNFHQVGLAGPHDSVMNFFENFTVA